MRLNRILFKDIGRPTKWSNIKNNKTEITSIRVPKSIANFLLDIAHIIDKTNQEKTLKGLFISLYGYFLKEDERFLIRTVLFFFRKKESIDKTAVSPQGEAPRRSEEKTEVSTSHGDLKKN